MNKQQTIAALLFTWFLLLSGLVMFGQAKHEHTRKELEDIEYKLSDPPIPIYHMKCGLKIGQYEWNKLPEMVSDSIRLVMPVQDITGKVVTGTNKTITYSDTLRVRMLVTYKNQNRGIAFTIDGYEVMQRSEIRTSTGWKTVHESLSTAIYLDDRKRVIKNLEIWQVKAR